MSLPLPGERRPPLLEALLAILVVIGLCAAGCATSGTQGRRRPAVLEAAEREARRPPPATEASRDENAAFVERALREAGLRFGTDGSAGALWGYLRTSQRLVEADHARPGDVVFFDTRGLADALECADQAGIVESVEPDGRITVISAGDGGIRRAFVDPARPTARRGDHGEILNSFLRPKRVDDPPNARYFAGEMLCGVARARLGG